MIQRASTVFVMDFVFPPPQQAYLPIKDSDKNFAIHRIYCVGRNYADHAIEMGHDPDKEPPFFFQKNPDNLVIDGGDFPYPPLSSDVHHEIEQVVALQRGGKDIAIESALEHVFGYAAGLDMTRRDLQAQQKKMGRPWGIGKAFEHSAPCGALVPASEIGHPDRGAVTLKVNDELRQVGDLSQLIWKVPEIISILSSLFELKSGDLIMTGTPAGVGPVYRGDRLEGTIEGIGGVNVSIV